MQPLRKTSATRVLPAKEPRLKPLPEALVNAREKVEADVLRFRTCCADPRASK
jgi:hypothetical protein